MDRKEFLSQVGFGAASLLFLNCLGGCSKSADAPATPANVDFTVDLGSSANSPLANEGGYIYTNGIVVAKTVSGNYIAVSQACTHEGASVQYQTSGNRFYCPNHGSTFSTTGAVINGPATRSLAQYNVAVSGTNLRVYS
jgi:cytochrome b6-f complex iron-sulfur subunit